MLDPLFRRITEDETLSKYICADCQENDVSVSLEELELDSYLILKVDAYYKDLKLGENTPPSPDCLIIQQCESVGYKLDIVELKDIKATGRFDLNNIIEKFKTCLDDFISVRFKELLKREYVKIFIWFVSKIESYKRDLPLKLEAISNLRLKLGETPCIPKIDMPIPKIKRCY